MAKRAKTTRDDDDLISSLPDEIITQILSFIPTKSAVATSVLSKRWNHLWTSVPNLDFGKLTNRLHNRHHQQKFIDRVLTLNSVSCVRKIRLKYAGYLDFTRKNAWISSIANRDAEIININLPNFSLPGSFFNKQNLVKLKLANCCMQQLVSFPNLKTIHLTHIHFLDENSLKNLLFGCPGLKKLYIESSNYRTRGTFNICSSTLHVLHLCNSYGCKFVVDTPNLTNLHIEERFGESNYYNITNASSLVKLHLHLNTNDAMSHEHLNMPIFQDLIHLTFIITKEEHWRKCFSGLLHNTPNLVTLVLLSEYYVRCVWYDPNKVPHCLSRLENVEITIGFELCRQEEMMMTMMISYILKNANVLKKLSIYTSGATMWNKNKFVKTLLALPRSSDACQVCIC